MQSFVRWRPSLQLGAALTSYKNPNALPDDIVRDAWDKGTLPHFDCYDIRSV